MQVSLYKYPKEFISSEKFRIVQISTTKFNLQLQISHDKFRKVQMRTKTSDKEFSVTRTMHERVNDTAISACCYNN